MGEVKALWPTMQSDITLARGPKRISDAAPPQEVTLTRGELLGEVDKLAEVVQTLTPELDTARSGPDAELLLSDHRREVDGQIGGLINEVKSCLVALTRLEIDVIGRLDEVERQVGDGLADEDLQEVERRLRAEVAKVQADHQEVAEQVIDLRSGQQEVAEELTDHQRIRGELGEVAIQLQEAMHTLEFRFTGDVTELRDAHDHLMAHVVDLRTLQSEIGSRQMATIVENGRLRDELLKEVTYLRAIVEESHDTASKAMSRASTTADNNDALQAEFDENIAVAERRLALVESLISQVDQRLHDSHKEVSELAAQAIAQSKSSEIAVRARGQSNRPDEQELLAHVDARVAAWAQQSSELLDQVWNSTDEKLSHVEAVSLEHSRRGAAATDAVASRLRLIERRLDEFERLNTNADDAGDEESGPPVGW